MPSPVLPSEALDKKILDYILTITERARGWWSRDIDGTTLSRKDELTEYRLRMEGRRSVADLYHDAKNDPFEGSANVGVGIEPIFAEYLLPLLLANTHDLEPMLQVVQRGTKRVHDDVTAFHDAYHRYEVPEKRELLEHSTREVLTVGSAFHKWTYGTWWAQTEADFPVWAHPITGMPQMTLDPGTGRMLPQPADPKTPEAVWPRDPVSGLPLKIINLTSVAPMLRREGPELSVRPCDAIIFPDHETRPDPDLWDWMADDFEVSLHWLLGREGDPFHGKLKLGPLWQLLAIDPNALHDDPIKLALQAKPIKLRAFHGKYPAAADGAPVEIVALIAIDQKLNLGWRPSPFPRRPYFQRQVWHGGITPLGKGIPETVFAMRSAMDALLNQDIDAGNLYNHPPLLLSDLAMMEDEDYETTGPGASWILRDINGAKFLPPPISQRNPVELLNWLLSNTMRLWGVTDLTLNSPSQALSSVPRTASGTRDILTTGAVKFGHLTKRLATTDTKEYQYVHDCFRLMLANPKQVPKEGEPVVLPPADREAFFAETLRVASVANGITTNPILRQQTYTQLLVAADRMKNPFLIGDLAAYKHLTEEWVAAYGVDVTLKDPQALQQSQLFLDLLQTPAGQTILPQAIQLVIQQHQTSVAQGGNGHGRAPVAPPAVR